MNYKLSLLLSICLLLAACSPAAPAATTAPLAPTAAPVTSATTATAIPAPVATDTAVPNYPPLDPLFPASGTVLGYTAPEGPRTFVHSNLTDFVDGQADTYFAYNFQQVAVKNYMDSAGRVLHVEIWQFADPADAYGVYTTSRSVVTAGIGVDGSTTPERRIAFWQDRYYVHVSVTEKQPQGDLEAFAIAVSKALPTGGDHPALLQRLPADGLTPNDAVYFHLEITIQNEIYLGGTNKLGLSPKTNGLLAHYTLAGQPASLLLIEYPDAAAAAAGLQGLQSAQVDKLVASQASRNLLGAVVGSVDATAAKTLLDQALK
jgi:hypothetical protein